MKKIFVVMMAVMAVVGLMVAPSFAADKLIVKDGTGLINKFVVTDGGLVGIGQAVPTEPVDVQGDGISTNFRLTKFGGNPGAVFRAAGGTAAAPTGLAAGLIGGFVGAGYTNAGAWSPNKVGIFFRASEAFTASAQGTYITLETTTAGSTARVARATINDSGLSVVGAVSQTSSRALKDNIQELSAQKAMDAIKNITPVTYNYKFNDDAHVGFIAEDVPDLVAAKDRKTLSPMDIVAVLTKVVQEQGKTIEVLTAKIDMLEKATTK